MTRIFRPFLTLLVLCFFLGVGGGAAYSEKGELAKVVAEGTTTVDGNEAVNVVAPKPKAPTPVPVLTNPYMDYPNMCETFTVFEGTIDKRTHRAKVRFKRNRFNRKRSERYRSRDLVRLVAKEMGASEALLQMIAHHESTWNPEAIHILNPDLEANQKAWEKYSYHPSDEKALELQLSTTSKQDPVYYDRKRKLSQMRLYKGNPFWGAKLAYDYVMPEETFEGGEVKPEERLKEWRNVWGYGYGLYGMNGILFTHMWDKEAPPWILCGDEGIVATVVAVWSLRKAQRECDNLSAKDPEKYGTEGGTYEAVIFRFARGKCPTKKSKRLGKAWRKLMAEYKPHEKNGKTVGIDFTARAELGEKKFPRWKTHMYGGKRRTTYLKDEKGEFVRNGFGGKVRVPTPRDEIVAHMRAKAEKRNLLRETPLVRKDPATKPEIALR